ncbi:hepatocyte growth factor activator serine protease-like [Tubulanus polymorphus]|uniref:hepatocyte growth factor activator serine protease-like n=1 Tax=Tubulanus polymorphus TaxID=672921 RepID=UPI003DA34D96
MTCLTISLLILVKMLAVNSQTIVTYGGNSGGATCNLPFSYNNRLYSDCTMVSASYPWCSTTFDYNADRKWGYCPIQKCTDSPCMKGGTCTDVGSGNGFKCTCSGAYFGERCQYKSVVVTGGTALPGAKCMFPFLYGGTPRTTCINTGTRQDWCYTDSANRYGYCLRPCQSGPCRNGGQCKMADAVNYECECTRGWSGRQCQNRNCDTNPCQNGGTCSDTPSGYQCACTTKYSGSTCQYLAVETQGGNAIPGTLCMFPFTSGGTQYTVCAPGAANKWCYTDAANTWGYCVDPCEPNPCLNMGTCSKTGPKTYECTCTRGFSGTNCETPIDFCQGVVCQNRGTCAVDLATASGYQCSCRTGFSGNLCQNKVPVTCASLPCQNGGLCADFPNGVRMCTCARGFYGISCERAFGR